MLTTTQSLANPMAPMLIIYIIYIYTYLYACLQLIALIYRLRLGKSGKKQTLTST